MNRISLIASLLMFFACVGIARANAWQAVAPINIARSHFSAAVIDNKIYIGHSAFDPQNYPMEVLDLSSPQEWVTLPDPLGISPTAIAMSASVALNGVFYSFTANTGGFGSFSSVEHFNPANNNWDSDYFNISPDKVFNFSVVAYNNKIYSFAGITNKEFSKSVMALNPTTHFGQNVTKIPQPHAQSSIAVVNDKAYIIGGGLQDGNLHFSQVYGNVYAYDFKSNKWQTSGISPLPTPRFFDQGYSAPVLNGKIYLIGGFSIDQDMQANKLDKVEIYDPVTNTWQIGPVLPEATYDNVKLAANNAIYVIGGNTGENNSSAYLNSVNHVWKLADAWKASLNEQETCDLNGDGKFSSSDMSLFSTNCKNNTAYWSCDLNQDGKFDVKDNATYAAQWKNSTTSCN